MVITCPVSHSPEFESREPPILRRFSALLGCPHAVIRSELPIPRRVSDHLPHLVAKIAGRTRHQFYGRIAGIGGPVSLSGYLIASKGGDIPIVRRCIARARDLRALL
jgi:hypothetical protein